MNDKHVVISPHARFEMQRRGISVNEVMAVVRQPGQVLPSRKGREIYQSKLGARGTLLLRVIVKKTSALYHVVTAYKTSQIAKYWKYS